MIDALASLPPEVRSVLRVSMFYHSHAQERGGKLATLGKTPDAADVLGPTLGTALNMVIMMGMARKALGADAVQSIEASVEDFRRTLTMLHAIEEEGRADGTLAAEFQAARRLYAAGEKPPTLSEVMHLTANIDPIIDTEEPA